MTAWAGWEAAARHSNAPGILPESQLLVWVSPPPSDRSQWSPNPPNPSGARAEPAASTPEDAVPETFLCRSGGVSESVQGAGGCLWGPDRRSLHPGGKVGLCLGAANRKPEGSPRLGQIMATSSLTEQVEKVAPTPDSQHGPPPPHPHSAAAS